ncbi:MAG: toll/interleukin-1 receptor domain-containing protein [Hyphomonadaceae bacterium JAD_PAG50586_4]|nr:MAG: toll/interleukin-1 receptor domain-containing protein [Hyphomonadaceae bacterium JAD_PAG50586_4]
MADVFLSYAREDRERAEQVANALTQDGVDVFWDNEIPPGTTWADFIEQKLAQCKALIVLWSQHSTTSQWVREEARMGRDKGVLIPVMIDGSSPPFGFGEVQSANLAGWSGATDDANWRRFAETVKRFAASQPTPRAPEPPPRAAAPPPAAPQSFSAPPVAQTASEKKKGAPVWVWIVGAVVATVVVLGIIGSMMPDDPQIAATTPVQPAVTQPAQPAVNYQQQMLDRLAQVEQSFAAQGFQRMSEPVSGSLQQGAFADTPATLEVGGDYRIIGVCDSDCSDLDLFLYDQNNNVVSQDNMTDATPVVSVAPQWTGPFIVRAQMHACTVQPCYYALVLYGRPLQQ